MPALGACLCVLRLLLVLVAEFDAALSQLSEVFQYAPDGGHVLSAFLDIFHVSSCRQDDYGSNIRALVNCGYYIT
jgi:hypothetical protein